MSLRGADCAWLLIRATRWFGARPQILLDRRGPGVDALIGNIRAAIARYPYPHEYRAWPGPNSNTFTAFIAREVPELGLNLPSNAVGKDFLPGSALFASALAAPGFRFRSTVLRASSLPSTRGSS
jgi:Protein of unknown function (DUF3750)